MKPHRESTWSLCAMLALSLFAFSGVVIAKQNPADIGQWSSVYNLDSSLEEEDVYDQGLTGEIVHAAVLPPEDRDNPSIRVLLSCVPALPCSGSQPASGQKYGRAYVWKPSRPLAATPITVPATYPQDGTQDLFCGGHTFLADGSLFWPSGTNLVATCNPPGPCSGIYGHRFAWRLPTNSTALTWVAAGFMPLPRWYPTVTLLDTGNPIVLGHIECPDQQQDTWRDEFNAATSTWLTAQQNRPYVSGCPAPVDLVKTGDYPRVHLLSNGQLIHTNAAIQNPIAPHDAIVAPSRFLDISEQAWSCTPFGGANRRWRNGAEPYWLRLGGGSVQLITWAGNPGDTGVFTEVIYTLGGSVTEPPAETGPCEIAYGNILSTVDRLVNPTATAPMPQWEHVANLNSTRVNHNTVILLDGSIVVIGGLTKDGTGCIALHAAERYMPQEVFGIPSPVWVEMAAQQMDRLYHSIAVLLPNGDVLSGGGFKPEDGPDNATSHSVEVYSPPYMYRGVRPTIDPALLAPADDKHYGDTVAFDVLIATGAQVDRVALVRNGTSTHAFDMDQRYVELRLADVPAEVTVGSGTWHVQVQMPANGFVAPPGFYMLTVVDTQQRPSPTEWIRLVQ